MRDPRLVEIEFLMDLETRGMASVRSTGSDNSSTARFGQHNCRYGVGPLLFRDMVLALLRRGSIAGPRALGLSAHVDENELNAEKQHLIAVLIFGQPIDVVITHEGRLRLWTLRDELLHDPDLEPMGLRSKAAWERDLAVRLRWASTEEPLAIIFLDLDNFGAVNKLLGSAVGDDVLRATFALTKNLVGSRGQVYRFGGEEVGVLLPGTDLGAGRAIAEELREAIESGVVQRVSQLGRPQTASVGVAAFTAPAEARAAVERVDALMRRAKQAGKNRVEVDVAG